MAPIQDPNLVESLRKIELEKEDSPKKLDVGIDTSSSIASKRIGSNQRSLAPHQVALSQSFVFLLLILSTLASYHVGVYVRRRMVTRLEGPTLDTDALPAASTLAMGWIHCADGSPPTDALCAIRAKASSSSSDSSDDDEEDDDDDFSSHQGESHGQHLLADASNMDQDTLIPFIVELASSKGWTLMSHFCSNPDNHSCVLLFHGGHQIVIQKARRQLDILSIEDKPLLDWLDSLPLIHKWAFKARGTNTDPAVFDAGLSDMYNEVLGSLELHQKRLVAKAQSPFQEVAIYDIMDPRIHSSQKYERDRQLFLDGVVQSRRHGERAYHEALVHPPMMMHPNPEYVAIVGGGEGGTLREVLKHTSLKQVIMIEIDDYVMDLSRKYLPEWNDCSDLLLPEGMVNPTGNCFDDPRATIYAQDAIRWFMDRYPENGTTATTTTETLFDVIIMDALDPGDKVEFSDMLFDNLELAATFHRALSPNGIFQCQTGDQLHLTDPNQLWTRDRHSVKFVQNLGEVGFHRLLDYQEPSTRFGGLWSFLLASKTLASERWFANPALIDLELQQRAMPTKSGAWPFQYFDAATHLSYQASYRPVADVTCMHLPHLSSCQRGPGVPRGVNIPAWEALTLQDGAVVAQQDLEPGTYVGLEECVQQTWEIPHFAVNMIDVEAHIHMEAHMRAWKSFTFLFGTPAPIRGTKAKTVDMGNDAWMQNCRFADPTYERFEPGKENPMLDRFWRIYECAARRLVHRRVPAGSKVDCVVPTAD